MSEKTPSKEEILGEIKKTQGELGLLQTELEKTRAERENLEKEINPKESPVEEISSEEEIIKKIADILKNNRINQVIVHDGKKIVKENNIKNEIVTLQPDLDARTALYILNECNKKTPEEIYDEGSMTSVVSNNSFSKNKLEKISGLRIFLDAGGNWLNIEKDGQTTTINIDHHGAGKREPTSATKMIYEIMQKADLLKENPEWLKKFVSFVNEVDNLTYLDEKDPKTKKPIFDKTAFQEQWPYTFYALAEKIPAEVLLDLCKSGRIKDLSASLTEEQLKGEIGKIKTKDGSNIAKECEEQSKKVKITISGIKNAIKHTQENGLNLATESLGKIVYQNFPLIKPEKGKEYVNKIPNKLAFIGTKALGGDTYICWNKEQKNFFINSHNPNLSKIVEELNKIDPGCAVDVRGEMVFGKINNLTEEKFLNTIDPNILKNTKEKDVEKTINKTIEGLTEEKEDADLKKKINELKVDGKDIRTKSDLKKEEKEKQNAEEVKFTEILYPIDGKEAKEIFDKLPEEDKQKINLGLKTLGFKVEQKKNNFFAKTFNKIGEKVHRDNSISRFCKNLGKGFEEDAEKAFQTAEKIKNGEEKHKIQNSSLLFGNILRYGRVISDFTGISFASPLRYVMMGGMALTRGAKAATETRLENETLIEKTRIEDAEKAAEEAWKIYKLAQKKEGNNISASGLREAYLTQIPKDLQERLKNPSTANSFIQNIFKKSLEHGVEKINSKIEKIEDDTNLSLEEKNNRTEIILNKYKQKLSDYDRMLTQMGTVDELAMAGRYAQTLGKTVVTVATIETLVLSVEKMYEGLSHILSNNEISTLNTGGEKGILEDTLKTKTENIPRENNSNQQTIEELKQKITENINIKDEIIHKGQGIEHAFIKQIEHNPDLAKELGFKGNINDTKALHEFAGKEAHIIAIKEGFVDNAGHEVRITEAEKVAYQIKMENGHIVVNEKSVIDGKIIETHHEGDKFGEKLNKYESLHESKNTGEIMDEQRLKRVEDYQKTFEIHSMSEDGQQEINQQEIEHSSNEKKLTEYEDTSKTKGYEDTSKKLIEYEDTSKLTEFEDTSKLNNTTIAKTLRKKFPDYYENTRLNYQRPTAQEIFRRNPNNPFTSYLHRLNRITGTNPRGRILFFRPESPEHFVRRAIIKAIKIGRFRETRF